MRRGDRSHLALRNGWHANGAVTYDLADQQPSGPAEQRQPRPSRFP
jgi:hypothetical protein